MGSNPIESSCWALVPQVCSDLPKNREQPGTAYGSLAPKASLFLSVKPWRQTCGFNPLTFNHSSWSQPTNQPITEETNITGPQSRRQLLPSHDDTGIPAIPQNVEGEQEADGEHERGGSLLRCGWQHRETGRLQSLHLKTIRNS